MHKIIIAVIMNINITLAPYLLLQNERTFWPHHMACGILLPRPGIKLAPSAVGAQSLNHWTVREVPIF